MFSLGLLALVVLGPALLWLGGLGALVRWFARVGRASTPPAVPPPRARVSPILVLAIGLPALLLGYAVWRGTWTYGGAVALQPGQGYARLERDAAGNTVMRCRFATDLPAARVRAAVTDYAHFEAIFPWLTGLKAEDEGPEGERLQGWVRTWLGSFPFKCHITHTTQGGVFRAAWDEPCGSLTLNRGSWEVAAEPGDRGCTVTYTLEVDLADFPTFLIRCAVLRKLDTVVNAVIDHARQ